MADYSRSPVEYYLTQGPMGPKTADAFQQGQLNAETLARSQSAGERERALLPYELQEKETLDRFRRQQMEITQAAEGRTVADYERLGSAFESAGGAMPGVRPPTGDVAGRGLVPNLPGAAGLIAGFESFQPTSYDDVTSRGGQRVSAGQRIGFGSDTITRADGSVVRVTPGMTVTQEDAVRDLQRRISTEFGPRAVGAVGAETWGSLPPAARDALVSVTYNYGSLPQPVTVAARTGDPAKIAAAIEGLAGDNDGINRNRRLREAAYIRESVAATPAAAAPAAAPAAPAGLTLPQGALSPAPMALSTGGVPMTTAAADMPAADAFSAQFVGPLDAQGNPAVTPVLPGSPAERATAQRQAAALEATREAARQRTLTEVATSSEGQQAINMMEQGRMRQDRDMYNRGLTQFNALTDAAYARLSQAGLVTPEVAQPPVVATPTPTPSVGLSQPMSGLLPGATAPLAQTLGAGVPSSLGAMMSPVPVGQQAAPTAAVRATTTTPAAPPPGAPPTPTAPTPGAPAPASIPALLEPATIARERQLLDVQRQAVMNQRRIAIASRNAQTLAAADAALAQLSAEDTRVGGMEALTKFRQGNPGALADYFYTMTNGAMRLQQNPDNTYNVLNGNTVSARNVTPETLENYFRGSFDKNVIERIAQARKTQAERADELFKTQLKMLQEAGQQEAIGTRDRALESLKAAIKARTGQEPKMEVQNDTVYIFDPNNQRVSIGKLTNKSVTGQTLPNGQTRLVFEPGAYGTVPTR